MASLYRRGKIYHMQIGAHRESCRTSDRKEAEIHMASRMKDINNKVFNLGLEKIDRIKFKDFAKMFIDNHLKISNKNWQGGYGQALIPENPNGLVHYFGEKYLDEIKPLDIEGFKQLRIQKVKPGTVNQDLICLKAMYTRAITWEKASINPMNRVAKFKSINKRLRYYGKDELKEIVEAAQEPMKSMISVAVNTGMRVTEIISLKWPDIDFTKNLICIDYQKNGKVDYIPMNPIVRDAFMKIQRQGNSAYVFNKSNGKPYKNYTMISHLFKGILDKLDIKGTSFHTLRHTFASYLAMAGVDLYRISKLMRHSSIKMTERYAHLSPQHVNQAVEVLVGQFDSIWSQEAKSTKTTQSEIIAEKKEFEDIVSNLE